MSKLEPKHAYEAIRRLKWRIEQILSPGGPGLRNAMIAANRLLVGVQPSPKVLTSQLELVLNRPDSIEPMFRELLLSSESTSINVPAMLSRANGSLTSVPAVSMGTHCFTSSFLERWQLKRWSGPFDWLFSSIPMVSHCLTNDFGIFLNRDFYTPVPLELRRDGPTTNRVQHEYYRKEYGVEFVFNHHDVHLPEGHAYLTRCVKRLQSFLASSEPKVFLLNTAFSADCLGHLHALAAVLRERTTNFKLIAFLVHPAHESGPTTQLLHRDKELHVRAFAPYSNFGATHFDDLLDEHFLATIVLKIAQVERELA